MLNTCMFSDIKPSNILVNTDGFVKLCDFGVSTQVFIYVFTRCFGTLKNNYFFTVPKFRIRKNNY